MGDTKIEMKIDEEIKPLKELCEKIVKMATNEIEQNPSVDTHEMYEVVDMIKDLSEAKKFVAETCYKKYLLGVMEENEDDFEKTWDEDGAWDEEGRRYYRGQSRDSMGRYTSRGGNRSNGRGGRRGYQEPPYYHMMPEDDYMMDMETYKNHSAKELRDLDRQSGRLYFTDMGMGNSSSQGNSQGSSQGSNRGSNQGRDSREGRSGMSRRSYMETKEMNPGNSTDEKQTKMKELDKYMNELGADIKEMVMGSSPEEKTMLKTKMQNLMNTL